MYSAIGKLYKGVKVGLGLEESTAGKVSGSVILSMNGAGHSSSFIEDLAENATKKILGKGKVLAGASNPVKGNLDFKTFINSNDADAWASKEYEDWLNLLSEQEKEAIRLYTGPGHYENMNAVLRGIETKYLGNNAEIVEQLTSTLNKTSIPESVTLFRGTSQAMLGDLKSLSPEDLVGKIIGDEGFMSASLVSDVAEGTFKGDLTLIINAPTGTQGAYVASLNPYPEVELLLNRGQQMVVTEVVNADASNLVLKVEIIN